MLRCPYPNLSLRMRTPKRATRRKGGIWWISTSIMWSKENGSGHTWVMTPIRAGDSRALFENLMLPGLVQGAVRYQARVAIRSNPAATVRFESNGALAGSLRAARSLCFLNGRGVAPIAVPGVAEFERDVGADELVHLSHGSGWGTPTNDTEAAVDWVRIFYPQRLWADGDSLHFSTPGGETGTFEFALEGFTAEPLVWDVTEPGHVRSLAVRQIGNTWRVQMQVADASTPRELAAFRPSVVRPLPTEDCAACRFAESARTCRVSGFRDCNPR